MGCTPSTKSTLKEPNLCPEGHNLKCRQIGNAEVYCSNCNALLCSVYGICEMCDFNLCSRCSKKK